MRDDAGALRVASLVAADLGVIVPVALVIAGVVGLAAVVLAPDVARSPSEIAAAIRAEPVLSRSRTAALLPLVVLGAFAWAVAIAHVARDAFSAGTSAESGAFVAIA